MFQKKINNAKIVLPPPQFSVFKNKDVRERKLVETREKEVIAPVAIFFPKPNISIFRDVAVSKEVKAPIAIVQAPVSQSPVAIVQAPVSQVPVATEIKVEPEVKPAPRTTSSEKPKVVTRTRTATAKKTQALNLDELQ